MRSVDTLLLSGLRPSIRARTLISGGTHDNTTPIEPDARTLVSRIPGARLEVLDAAHLATMKQPSAANRLLIHHLRRASTRDRSLRRPCYPRAKPIARRDNVIRPPRSPPAVSKTGQSGRRSRRRTVQQMHHSSSQMNGAWRIRRRRPFHVISTRLLCALTGKHAPLSVRCRGPVRAKGWRPIRQREHQSIWGYSGLGQ